MQKPPGKSSPVIRNRKATYKYEILEKIECGIELCGTEVKSLREGRGSLDEAYASIRDNEVWLLGFHIPPYSHGNELNHEPVRPRKLLMHRREIEKLLPRVTQKGQTLIPLRVYFNARGWCKVQIALGRGKAQRDRRQDLKARDHKREMDRAMRRR